MPNPLRHPSRRRIIDAVRETLGLNEAAIQATTGLSRGAARHHLRALIDAGILKRVPLGRDNHYFPSGIGQDEARCLAALRHGRAGEIMRQIILDPEVPQWELLDRLGMTRKVLNQNVAVLLDAGMVQTERVGRHLMYRPADFSPQGRESLPEWLQTSLWRGPASSVVPEFPGKILRRE